MYLHIIVEGGRMKLYISNVGIVESVSQSVEDGKSKLQSARSRRLYAPSTFQYASYCSELKRKIQEYYKELNYIYNALKKSERKYDNLFSDEIRTVDRLRQSTLDERNGVQDIL